MKKLSLLLPLLALAASPARAEDPATNAPVADEPHAESAERFPLRHTYAHEAAGQIERMAAEDGRGDGFALRVEERTNSLLFSGSDSDLEFVRDCVGKLDVPQEQVADENVQAFLRRLEEPGVIPELEWRDAPIDFVAEFLVDASLILNPGTFEERGGVHFTTDAAREDFPKDAVPRVSVRVPDRVSLLQAADLAAEAAGWRRTVYPDKRTVRIGRSRSCGPVSFTADAATEFAAALERELPAAENPDESARLKSFFAARGVRWSESDEARLLPAPGKLVFFVEEPESARRIRAILAAPGFAPRRIPLRAKVVSFAGDPARFGLGGRDAALAVRALPPETLAEVAAAFEAGAEVAELEPLQAEEGLPATWTLAPTDAAGFAAEATPTPAADGEGLRVHFVLRSFPPAADAEAVPPHGCAGDADLAPGEALLVGAIPVAGSPDRSLALLLEFRAEGAE